MGYMGPLPENALRYLSKEQRTPMGKSGRTMSEIDEANAIKAEKELHRQVEQYLNMKGVMFNHDRMDKRRTGRLGWPDFDFAIRGQAIAVECKAPGKDLDGKQPEVRMGLLRDGWTYIICYRLEQVIELFKT
jgi:hypothetical protein